MERKGDGNVEKRKDDLEREAWAKLKKNESLKGGALEKTEGGVLVNPRKGGRKINSRTY